MDDEQIDKIFVGDLDNLARLSSKVPEWNTAVIRDQISYATTYNRTFLPIPYAIQNQREASRGLWMQRAVLYGIRELA